MAFRISRRTQTERQSLPAEEMSRSMFRTIRHLVGAVLQRRPPCAGHWARKGKGFLISATLTTIVALPHALAAQDELSHWPQAADPRAVGKLLSQRFVESPHQYVQPTMHYAEMITWYGALRFARDTGDDVLRDRLIDRFRPLLAGGREESLVPHRRHVDDSVFGVVPLEIARQTRNSQFLSLGLSYADRQWEDPIAGGLSPETRFWIDDMYMVTVLQIQAYRATGDPVYLDRAAREMVMYLGKLQQPSGLFFHAQDVPIYWGRGNGWVAAGMTELLSELPESHPDRPVILRAYRKMMSALLGFQGKDGMWRQLIDHDEAWPETSGSAMFTFAMVSGVKSHWLDARLYAPAARRAWIALVGYLDQNGDMTNVCEGTNKLNDPAYYLARRRRTGDFHGQAPMLWIADALLEPARPTQFHAAGQ